MYPHSSPTKTPSGIFDVHGSVHRKHIFKYNQKYATLQNLFTSVKCSTCFRRSLHPSSGAQNCIYGIAYFVKTLLLLATVVEEKELLLRATTVASSSKGLTKYLMLYIQFWSPDDGRKNRLKHVEKFTELTFRHRASSILGQAFHYSPENAFYIFNQQIYFIIWYMLDRASLI